MSLITLTTDFGHADWFVGAVKGVIMSLAPSATVVDLCHGIEAGNIRAGAFALAAACNHFPEGTVHAAVVDPGVGSGRAAIAAQTGKFIFVGPDNGILSLALRASKVTSIRQLTNPDFFLNPVSHTFHGRDVFAPVAAHLSRDPKCFSKLGPELNNYQKLDIPEARQEGDLIRGAVVYIDHFGNALTNIHNEAADQGYQIVWCSRAAFPLKPCYQGTPQGHGVAVRGSAGFIEIAVNGGNAAERFKLKTGAAVTLRRFKAGQTL
jgi:S-adenosylmethionine hydrolase